MLEYRTNKTKSGLTCDQIEEAKARAAGRSASKRRMSLVERPWRTVCTMAVGRCCRVYLPTYLHVGKLEQTTVAWYRAIERSEEIYLPASKVDEEGAYQ